MTYVTAKVDIVQQYVTQGGKVRNNSVGSKIINTSYQDLLSEPELRKHLEHRKKKLESDCEGKLNCGT
jgi:hypothetical protein